MVRQAMSIVFFYISLSLKISSILFNWLKYFLRKIFDIFMYFEEKFSINKGQCCLQIALNPIQASYEMFEICNTKITQWIPM